MAHAGGLPDLGDLLTPKCGPKFPSGSLTFSVQVLIENGLIRCPDNNECFVVTADFNAELRGTSAISTSDPLKRFKDQIKSSELIQCEAEICVINDVDFITQMYAPRVRDPRCGDGAGGESSFGGGR